MAFGAVSVPPSEVIAAIGRALRGRAGGLADTLIVDVRLPRVLLAALVGAALAGAGTLYQALFRNPLADPYILGISSGAGLGAMIALVLTAGATALRFGAVPVAAFVGAMLTMLLVVRLADVSRAARPDVAAARGRRAVLHAGGGHVVSHGVRARADGRDRLLDDGRVLGGDRGATSR